MTRRRAPFALLAGLILSAAAAAQPPTRVISDPPAIPVSTLDRLHLAQEWRIKLPMDSIGNGIAHVQILRDRLYVQLFSGTLVALDAATGRSLWIQSVDTPYTNVYPMDENDGYVFLVNSTRLYCFNRSNGIPFFVNDLGTTPVAGPVVRDNEVIVCLSNNQVQKFRLPTTGVLKQSAVKNGRRISNQPEDVPASPEGAPARVVFRPKLGFESFFKPAPTGVVVETAGGVGDQKTPSIAVLPSLRPPYRVDTGSRTESVAVLESLRQPYQPIQPGSRTPSIATRPPSVIRALRLNDLKGIDFGANRAWTYQTPRRVVATPLATDSYVLLPITAFSGQANVGRLQGVTLDDAETDYGTDLDGMIAAPLTAHDGTAFVATLNSQYLAFNIATGRVAWQETGGPFTHRPVVTDGEAFFGGPESGLSRVDRRTGELLWNFPLAGSLRAANPKFVYAVSNKDRLYVIDRARSARQRGSELSSVDIRQFPVPVVNHADDRLYLAANDGTIVCLHDRDYPDPIRLAAPPAVQTKPVLPGDAPPLKKDGGPNAPKTGDVEPADKPADAMPADKKDP